jgi:hypothetical protein
VEDCHVHVLALLMNPYAPPQLSEYVELAPLVPEEAKEQLRLPAYGLIASGVAGIALAVLAMAAAFVAPTDPERALISPGIDRLMTLIAGCLLIVVQVGIIRGGMALLTLETYRVARVGVLLAVLSFGGAFLVGFPFGLWAMLRLFDSRIRGAFAT